jgi:hypothetical protein
LRCPRRSGQDEMCRSSHLARRYNLRLAYFRSVNHEPRFAAKAALPYKQCIIGQYLSFPPGLPPSKSSPDTGTMHCTIPLSEFYYKYENNAAGIGMHPPTAMSTDTEPKLFSPLSIPEYEQQTVRYERRDALLQRHLNTTRAFVRAFDFATS